MPAVSRSVLKLSYLSSSLAEVDHFEWKHKAPIGIPIPCPVLPSFLSTISGSAAPVSMAGSSSPISVPSCISGDTPTSSEPPSAPCISGDDGVSTKLSLCSNDSLRGASEVDWVLLSRRVCVSTALSIICVSSFCCTTRSCLEERETKDRTLVRRSASGTSLLDLTLIRRWAPDGSPCTDLTLVRLSTGGGSSFIDCTLVFLSPPGGVLVLDCTLVLLASTNDGSLLTTSSFPLSSSPSGTSSSFPSGGVFVPESSLSFGCSLILLSWDALASSFSAQSWHVTGGRGVTLRLTATLRLPEEAGQTIWGVRDTTKTANTIQLSKRKR